MRAKCNLTGSLLQAPKLSNDHKWDVPEAATKETVPVTVGSTVCLISLPRGPSVHPGFADLRKSQRLKSTSILQLNKPNEGFLDRKKATNQKAKAAKELEKAPSNQF